MMIPQPRHLNATLLGTLAIAVIALMPRVGMAQNIRLETPGVAEELREAIEAASLLLQPIEEDAEQPSAADLAASAQADYARITAALYDRGYFSGVINILVDGREAAALSPVTPPARINTVTLRVNPGPQFQFGQTQIAPLTPETDLPEEFASGQTAGTGPIRAAVEVAIDGWRDVGRARARVTGQSITAQHRSRKLDVGVRIDPGPRLRFGDLIISGNMDVRTDRIREIAGLPSGEVYAPQELELAAGRLRRTRAFQSVSLVEADQIGPGQTLDIKAQLAESKPRRFGFGAEVSSLEGAAISAYWLHRNFLGGAERLRFDAEISGVGGQSGGTDGKLAVRFERPATFNEDTDFYATAEIERLDEVSFKSTQASVEAGITRYASLKRQYRFGLGLRTAKTEDAFGERRYTLLTFPVGATFDYRNDGLNATAGYYADINLTPFVGLRGTDNGLRTYIDARAYKSFGAEDNVTFALRGQLGAVSGVALDQAPADYLFYSGGGGTVRGQRYQSLAVTLDNGSEVGGRSFLGLAAEARVKTTDSLSLVAFLDAGYVGREAFPDGSTGDWHTGAGLGVRYNTGIGPIRLDIGLPVSQPGDRDGVQIYIGIGQAF